MREHYIPQKIIDLFHVKHKDRITAMEAEAKVARIMNVFHSEILLANEELERKLVRKLELVLREQL